MLNRVQLIALKTIARAELTRLLRIWSQTLLPPMVTMSLYFVIFGQLIGQRIGLMGNMPYMDFIVPGLIMMAVIQNAYMNTSSSFFGAKFGRSVEELLTSPAKNYIIVLGYAVGGIYRGILAGVVVTVVSLYFTHLLIHHLVVMLITVLLTASLFSFAGLINGLLAKKFDDVAIIPTFVLTPLTYLGGVFYSVSLLEGIWYKIALVNPIVYMVATFRYGMLGTEETHLYSALGIITGFNILLFGVAVYLLHCGIGTKT